MIITFVDNSLSALDLRGEEAYAVLVWLGLKEDDEGCSAVEFILRCRAGLRIINRVGTEGHTLTMMRALALGYAAKESGEDVIWG